MEVWERLLMKKLTRIRTCTKVSNVLIRHSPTDSGLTLISEITLKVDIKLTP